MVREVGRILVSGPMSSLTTVCLIIRRVSTVIAAITYLMHIDAMAIGALEESLSTIMCHIFCEQGEGERGECINKE